MTTLKSNNNRLTSALQESTANVDEWKRQLHTYKEENLRLKREMDAMKPIGAGGGGGSGKNNASDGSEEMRIEIIRLNSQILSMEKEMNELELKSSKSNIRDKSNEQSVSFSAMAQTTPRMNLKNFHQYFPFSSSLSVSTSCQTNCRRLWSTCAMYNKKWRKFYKNTKALETRTRCAILK